MPPIPPTTPDASPPPGVRGHDSARTGLDRVLPEGVAPSPTPDFVPVLISLAATVIGVLVLAYVWTLLNNPAHGIEVYTATQPVAAFGHTHPQAPEMYGATAYAGTAPLSRDGPRMPSFSLVTQHGDTKHVAFPRRRPLILAVGDRKAARHVEDWIEPLKRRYADAFGASFDVHGVADLSDVSSMARSVVVLVVRERTDYPVMLDWHGEIASTLKVNDEELTVFVVDSNGRIRLRLTGRATTSRIGRLSDTIDTVLEEASQGLEADAYR